MAIVLLAQPMLGCDSIFDLRGLIAEEYADAGIWREGSVPFRAIKRIERAGLRRASQIVVLTERARDWLTHTNPTFAEKVTVIPCCVNLSRFIAGARRSDRFELVYAGSVVGLYLLEEMGRFFV